MPRVSKNPANCEPDVKSDTKNSNDITKKRTYRAEEHHPPMEELQRTFQRMTIGERRASTRLSAPLKSKAVDNNVEVEKATNKEGKINERGRVSTMKNPVSKVQSASGKLVVKKDNLIVKTREQNFPGKTGESRKKDKQSTAPDSVTKPKVSTEVSGLKPRGQKSTAKRSVKNVNREPDSSDSENTAPVPRRKPRSRTHQNSTGSVKKSVNNDNSKEIKTEIQSSTKENKSEKTIELKNNDISQYKINKTELPSTSNSGDIETLEFKSEAKSKDKENPRKHRRTSGIPRTASQAVSNVKRENQSSPQSPIASVAKYEVSGTPPPTPTPTPSTSFDIRKYEKFTNIGECNIVDKTMIKEEKVVKKNLSGILVNEAVIKKQLTEATESRDGCAPAKANYPASETEGKTRVNDTLRGGLAGSDEKSTALNKELRHQDKKDEKVAVAFEKFGRCFVSTAKKMGYLGDSSSESTTTDDSEYSEHSTSCSCSYCEGSTSSTTDSDDFTEFTPDSSSDCDVTDSTSSPTTSTASTTSSDE